MNTKKHSKVVLSALMLLTILAGNVVQRASAEVVTDMFSYWTDEQLQHYEDSVYSVLYPPVIAMKADSALISKLHGNARNKRPRISVVNRTPISYPIDTLRSVGQIDIVSGTSKTGAKTYEIPINVCEGRNGFQPKLSLTYNSQYGNSEVGMGWKLSGVPLITRCGKTIFYNGKTEGVKMDNTDVFLLDGIRLIPTEKTTAYTVFETEYGNIFAKGYTTGNVMNYFEVFYPDGRKGEFRPYSNPDKSIEYPVRTLSDQHKNTIQYTYIIKDNHYSINRISYSGGSVNFYYNVRTDTIVSYSGGIRVANSQLLKSIICSVSGAVGRIMNLNHWVRHNTSLLGEVAYFANDKCYNTLKFSYDYSTIDGTFSTSTTQLYEWYTSEDPNMVKAVKGKFDYDSGADGLIVLPNMNPYWKHHKNSGTFSHSENRFDNKFTGDEKIFLYAGLKDYLAYPMPNLKTEKGFVDILCADLKGQQEDCIIKINDNVVDGKDQVKFQVYRSTLSSGLTYQYTRTFNFNTVYSDAKNAKSIQPKFYYTGDFDGDGKMEILAVSVHQPFNDSSKPSICYIFNLENSSVLHENHLFPYNVRFVGNKDTDATAAANDTDKLFAIDYDGDGKTDLCHINESGVNIYTFEKAGTPLVARKVATYTGLNKTDLKNRQVLPGDFNGDGLTDLLVSASTSRGDMTWNLFFSKGDGQFDKFRKTLTSNNMGNNGGFLIQDVNGDGKTDLIEYNSTGFYSYCAKNFWFEPSIHTTFAQEKSVIVPTDINAHSCYTKLISLKDGKATKYSFSRNDNMNSLITGMINSLSVVELNDYQLINDEGADAGIYLKGYGATFPYANIQEPLPVIASTSRYLDGKEFVSNKYYYRNAIIHRQGFGFCGFEEITTVDKKGDELKQTYTPTNFSLLVKEECPAYKKTFDYNTSREGKVARVTLKSKTEQDLVKGNDTSFSFTYDRYGFPTKESVEYSGGITKETNTTYAHKSLISDDFCLGMISEQTVTTTRDNSSVIEQTSIPSYHKDLPLKTIFKTNGTVTSTIDNLYDDNGLITTKGVSRYSQSGSDNTSYTYDSYGRLIKENHLYSGLANEYTYDDDSRLSTLTDYAGRVTTYTYDNFGREASVTYPDGTSKTIVYSWCDNASDGVYAITVSETGKPSSTTFYDALNRKVKESETRFDGSVKSINTVYDSDGNVKKVSRPYTGSQATKWDEYTYDDYGRILTHKNPNYVAETYTYSGNSVTIQDESKTTVKAYDAQGNLITVTDPGGTINYTLGADGQPEKIESPDGITTTIGYDSCRRRTSLTDPSLGTTTYEYNDRGDMVKETTGNGDEIVSEYDSLHRLTGKSTSESSTTYTYNNDDLPVSITTVNGNTKTFSYDTYGRVSMYKENGLDGKWLQKDYTYSDGNISSVKYTSQSGVLATVNYTYANGHLTEAKLNGTTSVFKLVKEDDTGKTAEIETGGITRKYEFDELGYPDSRSANKGDLTYQHFEYSYNYPNMTFRADLTRKYYRDEYQYDEFDRLSDEYYTWTDFDNKGNITSKKEIGTYHYERSDKPYAVTSITLNDGMAPLHEQDITYYPFLRPKRISERNYVAEISYGDGFDRIRTRITKDGNEILSRYYLAECYEYDRTSTSSMEKLYLLDDYYNAVAVLVKEGASTEIYYRLHDYLGSVTHIVRSDGTLVQELSYDAWGRMRDPDSYELYQPGDEPEIFLGRGYTGHEHLTHFGLINMNARLYDPVISRFLSPDPYVQMPENSQNFNRYSYALNNPFSYTDESGEFLGFIIVGVIVGGVINVATHWDTITSARGWNMLWKGAGYFATGGIAGGVGAAAAVGVASLAGVGSIAGFASLGTQSGIIAGATSGALSSAAEGFTLRTSNSLLEGNGLGSSLNDGLNGMTSDVLIGGVSGGILGGYQAVKSGQNIWTGANTSSHYISNNTYLSSAINKNTYSVYYGIDPNTNIIRYIGITSRDPVLRFAEHLRSKSNRATLDYFVVKGTGDLNKLEARIMEQKLINQYGLGKNGGLLFNKRNEINPKLWDSYEIKRFF